MDWWRSTESGRRSPSGWPCWSRQRWPKGPYSRARPAPPSRWRLRRPRRSPCSGVCFAGEKTYSHAAGKTGGPGKQATHRYAGTNGSVESAESHRSSAANVPIRRSSQSATMSSSRILSEGMPTTRPISSSAFILCCGTRRAGFSPLISTRSPGCAMWPRFAIRRGEKVSQSLSNARAPATARMPGSFSPSPCRR
ncbi:MAG: hypothetical protein FJX60_20435 [Alphaproteobacteria bacterium]|nr:hypothetical protein [Alphaproteobacteria bacterium]